MEIGQTGNAPARVTFQAKSDEASATIPVGSPVCFQFDATDDGLAVILPSGSAPKSHALGFGVAVSQFTPGGNGRVQTYGFVRNAVILLQTRTASGESFSASTHSQGALLNVDTVNNAFSTSGGTLAKTSYLPFAVLAESTAAAASASTTADTRTAVTGFMKIFVRMM